MKTRRLTVEDILHTLDAASLARAGVLTEARSGIIEWSDGSSVSFWTDTIPFAVGEPPGVIVRLSCRMLGVPVRREITAWPMSPKYRKLAFQCCGHHMTRLYFYRGAIGCRHCFGLTYRSQQTSHARWRVFRQLQRLGVVKMTDANLIILAGFDRLKPERPAATIRLLSPMDHERGHAMK